MLSRKDLTLNTLMMLAMLSWGLSWTNAKLVGQYADATLIMVWRFLIAAVSIAPILLITKISFYIKKKDLLLIFSNSLFMVSYNYIYFKGTQVGLAGTGGVLVTTLTKKMSEALSDYLLKAGIKTRYLHSDIDTLERIEILRDLRKGEFDVLVGINLLREGLDIPEVSLVAILDADKEGFLRSETSMIQTIGRAARHINGHAILYADKETGSIERLVTFAGTADLPFALCVISVGVADIFKAALKL